VIEIEFPLEEFKVMVRAEAEVVRPITRIFPIKDGTSTASSFSPCIPIFGKFWKKFLKVVGE